MTKFQPMYHVRDEEEYKKLKDAWEEFLNVYSFCLDSLAGGVGEGIINIEDVRGIINIFPREGEIERMVKVGGNENIKISDISKKQVNLIIGKTNYRVRLVR